MNRIYCAIGKITEVTQFIELMVSDICELSEINKEFARHEVMSKQDYEQVKDDAAYIKQKMSTMTFGQQINILNESKSLERDELNELRTLLEKRNYFTHEYFKCTKFGCPPNEQMIVEEFEAIKQYLAQVKKMENKLRLIKEGLENKLRYNLKKSGL